MTALRKNRRAVPLIVPLHLQPRITSCVPEGRIQFDRDHAGTKYVRPFMANFREFYLDVLSVLVPFQPLILIVWASALDSGPTLPAESAGTDAYPSRNAGAVGIWTEGA